MRRLVLLSFVAGCAGSGLVLVPDKDWRAVPEAERAPIERRHAEALAQAHAELRLATAAASEPGRGATPAPRRPLPATADDSDRAKADALARIDAARVAQRRAEQIWRARRVEVATAHLEVIRAERERDRAFAIDRHLDGDDAYDGLAGYRGQFARAQERWYAAMSRAAGARVAFERASADVASHKEWPSSLARTDQPLSRNAGPAAGSPAAICAPPSRTSCA